MYKTFLLTGLAIIVLGTVMVVGLNAFDASGEISGIVFVLGSGAAGLIGGEIAQRTLPGRRRRN